MAASDQAAPKDCYYFGDFVLDLGARGLRRFGEPIPLMPKEFDTLVVLVEYAGQAVDKDTLVRRVWPDSFVGDGSLAKNISILRKHIGAAAIQTVSKYGYRFAWPVSIVPAADPKPEIRLVDPITANQPGLDPTPASAPANEPAGRNSAHAFWLGGLSVGACLILLGMWHTSRRSEVRVNGSPTATEGSQIGGTSNPLARDAYLRGRLALERKNEESGKQALQEFREATVLDPKFALAYAGLSEVYLNFANNTPTGPAYAKAKDAALTAIRLEERIAEAHRDLAFALDNGDFDWPGAEREYRRALELNPSDARAHHWYAQYLVAQGNPDEALREARAGLDLDPLAESSNYNYSFILIEDGKLDTAIEHLQRDLLREPNSEVDYGYLGIACDRKHEYLKSAEAFQRAADLSHLHKPYEANAARSLALGGKVARARQIVSRLRSEMDHGQWMPSVNLALAYFALGDQREGFLLLRKALQEHSCTLLEMNTEPMLVALKADPRMTALRKEFHFGGAP